MRQCSNGHIEVTWYDDDVRCPVCALATENAELKDKVKVLGEGTTSGKSPGGSTKKLDPF